MSEASERSLRSGFDWPSIKQRLSRSAAVLECGAMPISAQRKVEILKARARALARDPYEQRLGEHLEVIEFVLAYENYALEAALVREVHPLKEITPLPGTPAFVAGIVNVRGQIVSVVDLKRLFELPDKGLADLNKVIILENEQMEFGLLVDAVLGVRRIALQELQPPLPTLTGVRAGYVHGMTQHRMSVLDARKILADPAIVVRAGAQV